jgi:hypothetical protein
MKIYHLATLVEYGPSLIRLFRRSDQDLLTNFPFELSSDRSAFFQGLESSKK